jgi:hypothetical protein
VAAARVSRRRGVVYDREPPVPRPALNRIKTMPLLGPAAMLLTFDIAPEAIAEHDHWHTHEHLPERLSIPGFLRGTRWIALQGQPRYLVLYEVATLATLTSDAYLERLNNPSAWTAKMMPHYRGMGRGFCAVSGSHGLGFGHVARLLRFKPKAESTSALRTWLQSVLPGLPAMPGLSSAHLLEGAATPPMTNEQRIRGVDANLDWALLLTGYDAGALAEVPGGLDRSGLEQRGAEGTVEAVYAMAHSLSRDELAAS